MQQQRKRVAFLINSLEGGGAERVMCKLLDIMEGYFREENAEVYLILLDDVEEAHSCPAYVEKRVLDTKGSLLSGYSLLRSALQNIQPEICVSFLTRSNMLNVVLSKQLKYRAVISERVNTSSHFSGGLKDTFSKKLVSLTYPYAERIIAVSEGVKADLVKNFSVASERVDIVYNPYDISQIQTLASQAVEDLPTNDYIIGTGRLTKNKNFGLLIEAFAHSTLTDDLVILGQGEDKEALIAKAASLGVAERVHFLGFKANPYPYIQKAKFFVSTSNAEGFPNAIVEAMCLGKAVVATNCESGPAEILSGQYPLQVEHFAAEKYGCLCAVNDVAGVTQALNYLQDDIQCEAYAYKSAARARDFSNAIFRHKIINVLEPAEPTGERSYVSVG
ncbi:glycosyltransferase [Alteromonas pelagimontana]|uniref:Glycosyltransferase n=1 Tax=Alteromonas pelagimontana TaxID=1858656 RepID=A0A6M4MAK1_9ALTE|nr:glycosyltransferase [Alteromonas pelagimontana]QJR80194.1 glycosyltransferase [Alteromonas pelagimontana]